MDPFYRNRNFYETFLRYLLGLIMLAYGVIKIARMQFVIPSFLWEEPLKNVDGVTLTWVFLGHSPWFTILLGLSEAIPAILLLFRKTKLLGAVLLFPITLGVFLVNIAFDFLPNIKIVTAILLMINLVLLFFHFEKIKHFFNGLLYNKNTSRKTNIWEAAINILLIGIISLLMAYILSGYYNKQNILTGDWYNQRLHYWLNENNEERLYFQPDNSVFIYYPDGSPPVYKIYQLNEVDHLLKISNPIDTTDILQGRYRMMDENTIEWNIMNGEKQVRLFKRILK